MIKKSLLAIDIGYNNLGYCVHNTDLFEFGLCNITKEIREKNLKENVHTRNMILFELLDKLVKDYDVGKIVVEQQVNNNVIAMCLQSGVSMYCLAKNLHYTNFPARCKFTFTGETKYDSKKKEHKKMSIGYAKNIINNINKEKLEQFNKLYKKDDAADAICMALIASDFDKKLLKEIMIQKE